MIGGWPLRVIRERIVIVPQRFVLLTEARHEVRRASMQWMTTTQPRQARDSEEATTDHEQTFEIHGARREHCDSEVTHKHEITNRRV